jgi:hypothetical protein
MDRSVGREQFCNVIESNRIVLENLETVGVVTMAPLYL